jgi:hypothetical protein
MRRRIGAADDMPLWFWVTATILVALIAFVACGPGGYR